MGDGNLYNAPADLAILQGSSHGGKQRLNHSRHDRTPRASRFGRLHPQANTLYITFSHGPRDGKLILGD